MAENTTISVPVLDEDGRIDPSVLPLGVVTATTDEHGVTFYVNGVPL